MREILRVREYGDSGPPVIVLHGGPGAAGDAAALARGLSGDLRVLEPWQRGSGDAPLTVATHIADLHQVIETRCRGVLPALVGHSWGAMLALAYAAAHPDRAGAIVLVGCGTFDRASRARLREILNERMDDDLRRRIEELPRKYPDHSERIREMYRLTRPLYDYDPPDETWGGPDAGTFDLRAHTETWADMVTLQEEGVYPASFAGIDSPVLMLHGAHDPHPGVMIHAGLTPVLKRLEYREWERCGHHPWLEPAVRDEFFAVMRDWLIAHSTKEASDI